MVGYFSFLLVGGGGGGVGFLFFFWGVKVFIKKTFVFYNFRVR